MSLKVTDESESNQLDDFKKFIETSINSLGIKDVAPENLKTRILKEFNKYDKETYNKIMKTEGLVDKIKKLIEYDKQINGLLEDEDLGLILKSESVKKNWDKTMNSLARLQGLILLRRVTKDCGEGLEKIIDAMDNKLNAVNNILETDISS
jgi:hypothetical protein